MPDAPLVTISDPSDRGRPLDVVDDGGPRGPSGRTALLVVLVVLVVGGGITAVRSVREQRALEAERAAADRVSLRGELGQVYGSTTGRDELLEAEVVVPSVPGAPDRISDVRIRGEGLGRRRADLSELFADPAVVRPRAEVECEQVAAGRFPQDVEVVLDVVPRSGTVQSQRLPVADDAVREAALSACDLPDPDARPLVEASGLATGKLLVFVDPVPRSGRTLTIASVAVDGFAVTGDGFGLPRTLPVNTSGVYAFSLRVDDCDRARAATDVVVGLREGDVPRTQVAAAGVSQPQPDGVPTATVLQRLLERDC